MDNKLSNLIKKAQGNRTQNEFALHCEISSSALTRIRNGDYIPKPKQLKKIAVRAYNNITYEDLMIAAGYLPSLLANHDLNISPTQLNRNTIKIPVLGVIPAGIPIEAIEDIESYEDIPKEWTLNGEQYFGLRVRGDSMEPKYLNGDIVILRKQFDCDSGQNCAVLVNGYEATLKKVIMHPNGITLQPLNSKYDPVFYTKDEIESIPIKLLGVVVQTRRDE